MNLKLRYGNGHPVVATVSSLEVIYNKDMYLCFASVYKSLF